MLHQLESTTINCAYMCPRGGIPPGQGPERRSQGHLERPRTAGQPCTISNGIPPGWYATGDIARVNTAAEFLARSPASCGNITCMPQRVRWSGSLTDCFLYLSEIYGEVVFAAKHMRYFKSIATNHSLKLFGTHLIRITWQLRNG